MRMPMPWFRKEKKALIISKTINKAVYKNFFRYKHQSSAAWLNKNLILKKNGGSSMFLTSIRIPIQWDITQLVEGFHLYSWGQRVRNSEVPNQYLCKSRFKISSTQSIFEDKSSSSVACAKNKIKIAFQNRVIHVLHVSRLFWLLLSEWKVAFDKNENHVIHVVTHIVHLCYQQRNLNAIMLMNI